MGTIQTLGSVLGLGLVAGFRLYLGVLALGLGLHFGYLHLSPKLSHLSELADERVLMAAAIGAIVEFVADKIPWGDTLWDSMQTFIRAVGAGIIGAIAIGRVHPAVKIAAILGCAGVALAAHASKAAGRLLLNYSQAPLRNIGMSLIEDLLAPAGIWLALELPFLMLNVVAIFLVVFAATMPVVFRLMKVQLLAVGKLLNRLVRRTRRPPAAYLPLAATAKLGPVAETLMHSMTALPEKYWDMLEARALVAQNPLSIECAALNVTDLRNSVGFLFFTEQGVFFVTKKKFRLRLHEIQFDSIERVGYQPAILMDRLTFHTRQGSRDFCIFKTI